ncbi:uncharacterized protein LOC129235625 [Anastrepha obliqua]|uniref:uncharacterized protein LOC129235625 n=1 Tax=Anastrepha obliqua TaxID=95512 RepID=UPI0024090E62|nr:uncharacterized protein LOC129235625 [Anastrepha obliqua]
MSFRLEGLLRAKSIEELDKSANEDSQENSSHELNKKNGSSEEIDKNEDLLKSKELYNAEFLTFTAPEEDEDDVDEKIDELLGLIKSRRVLLIEAPENTTIIEFNGDVEESENIAKSLARRNNTGENVDEMRNGPTEATEIGAEDISER